MPEPPYRMARQSKKMAAEMSAHTHTHIRKFLFWLPEYLRMLSLRDKVIRNVGTVRGSRRLPVKFHEMVCKSTFSPFQFFKLFQSYISTFVMKTKDTIAGKQIGNCYAVRQTPFVLLQVTGGGETFVTVVRISIASQCSI
jgi:hypothetical protein